MKKIIFILLFIMFPTTISATKYDISEYGLTVDFNEEWIVVTQDTVEDEDTYNDMSSNSIYLIANSNDLEVSISITPNSAGVNSLLTEEFTDGEVFDELTVVENNKLVFLRSIDKDIKLEYHTIFNSYDYIYTFTKDTAFSEEDISIIDQIVKTTNTEDEYLMTAFDWSFVFNGAMIGAVIGGTLGAIGYLAFTAIEKSKLK